MSAPRTDTDLNATAKATGGGSAARIFVRTETEAASVPRTPQSTRSTTLFKHIKMQDDKNLLEKGFTLIELLVVVAILGILAAVAIFAVGNLTDNAKKNSCKTEMASVQTASDAWHATHIDNAITTDDYAADTAALATANLLKGARNYEGTGYTYSAANGAVTPVAGSSCA